MNKVWQYVICGVFIAFLTSLGIYARIWELRQPKQQMTQVKVISIEPYSLINDLHWSSRGYRVYITNEDKPIDFSSKSWDLTVEVGDIVDVIVRRSFPWFDLKDELDGLSIYEHE
jgi:hypothetical protein